MKQFQKAGACLKIKKDFTSMYCQKMMKLKLKKKRERSRKQTESHLNVEYKFVSKDNLEKDVNQTI